MWKWDIYQHTGQTWFFVTRIVLWKNCFSDRKKKVLKFEAEGRDFAKNVISLEQFIQTLKGQNNFWQKNAFFNLLLEVSQIW